MSKMKEEYSRSHDAAYEEYVESQRQELRDEGKEEYRLEIINMINVELLWKNQDEGFIGGLQWVLDKLNGVNRV